MAFRGGWWGAVRGVLPQVADAVYAFGSLGISASMLHNWPDPNHYWRAPDALAYCLLAAMYLPLAVRRRAPLLILGSSATVVLGYFTLAYYHPVAVCGLALANYTVAAHRSRTVSVPCTVTTWLVLLWGTRLAEPGIGLLSVAFVTATAAVTWVTGDVSRRLAERGRRLAALTEQLRREQEERTRRAVSDECMRIARELHDVIAHHVSVISIQAGLADYVFASDPPTAHRAIGVITDSARDAGDEMRRMLAVLRHGVEHSAHDRGDTLPDTDGAAPGMARLAELADRVRAAGVAVRITGEGLDEPLPAGLDMCVYRVVQEALTNVLKHAPTASATVDLSRGHNALRVRVTDDGPSRPRPEKRDGPGHGLIGMRERATIYGGTVTAGVRSQGGFEVDLVMPLPDM
ncbi:histidine kinase [Streptomyces sp. RerS4]|uniref:sensor histidine kinase n=1 Tax=Streptomyces sp. RerS4 TaxID=2942449 RepID=UPI00201BDC87|nr:histidine kinase [Streptomyces sp. RerS4]UQW99468.1 histidine kinase [Streptomyces sp. RerS4]